MFSLTEYFSLRYTVGMIDTAINIANFLGINPSGHPYIVLGVMIAGVFYLQVVNTKELSQVTESVEKLKESAEKLKDSVGKIKDNVLVVITHLTASSPTNGTLDTLLIQAMSPYTIQPAAKKYSRPVVL